MQAKQSERTLSTSYKNWIHLKLGSCNYFHETTEQDTPQFASQKIFQT